MVDVIIVTESETAADILRATLPRDSRPKIGIVQGYSSKGAATVSLARSVLLDKKSPLVLLLDAGTFDEDRLSERRAVVEDLLREAAVRQEFRLLFAQPEIEAVLFADPQRLAVALGAELSQREEIEAEFRPKRVLHALMERAGITELGAVIAKLDPEAREAMAHHPLMCELEEAVLDLCRANAA